MVRPPLPVGMALCAATSQRVHLIMIALFTRSLGPSVTGSRGADGLHLASRMAPQAYHEPSALVLM